VFFKSNPLSLPSTDYEQLDIIAKEVIGPLPLRVAIMCRADVTGSNMYTIRLSPKRAEVVRDYLVSQVIPEVHVNPNGKEAFEPIVPNDTKGGEAQDRRVELTVRPLEIQSHLQMLGEEHPCHQSSCRRYPSV
jgi:outer membrane protein OmpA-like peptidoglycan-associated protein